MSPMLSSLSGSTSAGEPLVAAGALIGGRATNLVSGDTTAGGVFLRDRPDKEHNKSAVRADTLAKKDANTGFFSWAARGYEHLNSAVKSQRLGTLAWRSPGPNSHKRRSRPAR